MTLKMKIFTWISLVGGLLWGIKPLYDWLFLDRVLHTGYQSSDPLDYVEFLFPLLCLSGLFVLVSKFKLKLTFSITLLTIAFVLNSTFHLFETYYSLSSVPYGLLFLLPGTAFLFTGALSLVFQLYKIEQNTKAIFYIAIAFSVSSGLLCLLPFAFFFLTEGVVTALTASMMTIIGFSFGSFSIPFLLKSRKTKVNISTEITT
ncbi:hypothetical protein [Bacillus sp. AK128]